jgi:hypothetical protein
MANMAPGRTSPMVLCLCALAALCASAWAQAGAAGAEEGRRCAQGFCESASCPRCAAGLTCVIQASPAGESAIKR